MKKKRIRSMLCLFIMVLSIAGTVYASTTIGTTSTTKYFQYYGASGTWQDLDTPQHYDKTTGNVAYCLDHTKDSPPSSATYNEFNPDSMLSSTVQRGLQAILENGYPLNNGGFSADQARYATANAIRAWLSEAAGIGYNFMKLSSGNVRAKSGYDSLFNWMVSLVQKARSGQVSGGSGGTITATPPYQDWQNVGGQLRATIRITLSGGITHYDMGTPPSGVTVSGYTGNNNDLLTITAPESMAGTEVNLQFSAQSSGGSVAMYWYKPGNSSYQPVLVVQDLTMGGKTTTTARIGGGEIDEPPPPEYYDLTVKKTDGSTGGLLDGATFTLYKSGVAVDFKAASGGQVTFSHLLAGTYTVEETGVPVGYRGATGQTITLMSNQTATFVNQPTELIVDKKDALTGQGMSIRFRINAKVVQVSDGLYRYNPSGSDTFMTNSSGTAKILALPNATYTVEEVETVTGYADHPAKAVTLNGTASVSFSNEPLTLKLNKIDDYTGKPMANVKFSVLNGSGQIMKLSSISQGYKYDPAGSDTFTTDSNGNANIYYLPRGSYTVTEAENVPGYATPKDEPLTLTGNNGMSSPATVGFKNEPLTLEFDKTDDLIKEPLDGAIFRLLDEQGQAVKLTTQNDGSYKPDAAGAETFTTKNGHAIVRYLLVGKYTIEEVEPPVGFMPDKPKPFTMTWENGTSNPVWSSMKDEPLTLEFTKRDAFTQLPMDGATFKLIDESGKALKFSPFQGKEGFYKIDPAGSEIWTTKGGKATLYYLPVGKYTVHEEKAAVGYASTLDKPATILISNGFSNPAKQFMQDEPLMLEVRKVDATNGQFIGGAIFRLIDEDGNTIKVSPIAGKEGYYRPDDKGAETFSVDNTGKARILYLPYAVYQCIEEQAPAGFAPANDAPITITVWPSSSLTNPARIDVKNTPLEFELTKTDKSTKAPLSGVSFQILDSENKPIKLLKQNDGSYKPSDKGTDTFVTGGDGKATVKYLPVGTYTAKELPFAGYVGVPSQTLEMKGTNTDKDPATLAFENIPTKIIIEKQDVTNGKPLDGAVFRLLQDGKPIAISKQKDGTYMADPKGSDTFTLEKGKAEITHVPLGKLTVEEVTAPKGYALAESVEVEITNEHSIDKPLRVIISDKPLALKIRKITKGNKPLSGAGFLLKAKDNLQTPLTVTKDDKGVYRYDPAGKETVIMVDGKGEATVYCLPVGDYQLEESVVPQGYFPAVAQKIIIKAENDMDKPFEAAVVNEPSVKLGLDTDRLALPLALGVIVLALSAGGLIFWKRRRAK